MSRALKRSLLAIGAAVGLLVLLGWLVLPLLDLDRYRPGLEKTASDLFGMDVRIGGRLRAGLFPGLHVTVRDGQIRNRLGATVASAEQTRLRIELLPLLHGEFRLGRIELKRPWLSFERDADGSSPGEWLKKAATVLGARGDASLSLSDGTLRYVDRKSLGEIEASGLRLNVSRIRLPAAGDPEPLKGLVVRGELACEQIRTKDLTVSGLKVSVRARDGVLELAPVSMRIFGGPLTGSVRVEDSGAVPHTEVRCSLPGFRIEEFLATLSPTKSVNGAMDFSAHVSMQGAAPGEMLRSAAGELSLRGKDLLLEGTDLDGVLARFESSQTFNLVDLGAVFLAGPLGLAVTKGYGFASLFRGSGGSSTIRVVVSDWTLERGSAQAKDVAMATSQNRIAMQGGLDLVNERFADMTVAAVDAAGCARVRQAIRGPFGSPVVEKPHVLTSLAGPVVKLYRQTRELFPSGPCEVFYAGSVPAPR